MKEAKVLICEPQYLSRLGLRTIIDNHPFYTVGGEAKDQDELEKRLENNSFDVITLGYSNDGAFGPETISLIQEQTSDTHILIISDEKNKRNIYDVLARGIDQFITKNCKQNEIIQALEACRNDQKYYCSTVLDIIIKKTFGRKEEDEQILSDRELEIVTLIAKGKIAKEISGILGISVHTIYTHRKNIMRKLKVSSPVELITYAINQQLVTL